MRTGTSRIANPTSFGLLAIGLILLTLVVTGCGLTPTHTPRASDQWSNGKLLGTAVLNNQVALQVDEAGDVFMVWVGIEHKLSFARLNERAEVVVQRDLDLRSDSAQKPQLLMDAEGQLHLIWLDRWEQNTQLFYARLSADGEVIQEATALSPPEQRATHGLIVLDPVGRTVEAFWSDTVPSRPGCYHAALDWSGQIIVPAEMLIADGLFPAAQTDRHGFVHLAWREKWGDEKPEFHYAVYDPQRRALSPDIVASRPSIQMGLLGGARAGVSFDGPWLGLDESSVYLAWVLEMHDRGEVRAFTYYQAFPQPVLGQRESAETFDYQPPEVTDEAVHVWGADPSMTGYPKFLDGQPTSQVLACYTLVSGPGNMETLQIAAIDLLAGQIEGQEIVNASHGASLQPNVAIDPDDNLHMAWIDTAGFSRYRVIYASTSPQSKETLNPVTAYDVVDKVLSLVMNAFSALFFLPVILSWLFIPVMWLIVFSTITRAYELSDPHGRTALVLAMLLQLGSKLFIFPDWLSQISLGSLLNPSLGFLRWWVFPLLLAVLSAGLTWAYLKRTRNQSVFAAYFVYALVDSLFTLIIYVALPMM